MTVTAHRRPIASHPAFAPVIALWFAALLGLTVAVLPAALIAPLLATMGMDQLLPLPPAARVTASALAATIGALIGFVLARPFARRAGRDPRPLYSETEPPFEDTVDEAPARRPLRVREELADGFGDESQVASSAYATPGQPEPLPVTFAAAPRGLASQEGFMILTPQPIHPPRPVPDLETLLDQFDTAFAAFSAVEGSRTVAVERPRADPVRAFVAQQTGVPAPQPAPAAPPLGPLVPDHQAELRSALDKLARSQRGDDLMQPKKI